MSEYQGIVSTVGDLETGFVQSINYSTTPTSAESKRSSGVVGRKYIFSEEISVDLQAEFDSSITLPKTGDTITVSGCAESDFNRDYIVDSRTLGEQNDGYTTIGIKATSFRAVEKEIIYDNAASS